MTATTLRNDGELRASERAGFRNIASRVRRNAGVDRSSPAAPTAPAAATVGEAARRLRAATRAEPATAPSATYWEGVLNGEEVIMFEVNVPEVIYLDSQMEQRAAAAEADRNQRHSALAERAANLLAAIEQQRLDARDSSTF
jgi:hypothetical protein